MMEITNESSLSVVHRQVGRPHLHADAQDISACAVVDQISENSKNKTLTFSDFFVLEKEGSNPGRRITKRNVTTRLPTTDYRN